MMMFIGHGKTTRFVNKEFCVLHVQSNTTVLFVIDPTQRG